MTLDGTSVKIIAPQDYEWLILRADVVTIKLSPATDMTRSDVLRELRHVVAALEADCG